MNPIRFLRPAILIFYIASCTGHPAEKGNKSDSQSPEVNITATDSFEAGKIISRVECKADSSESYALYIPSGGNKQALPVIYFFDPHGDGKLPLSKYKDLSDSLGFILVGSNNSKNGTDWSTTEKTWKFISDDTEKRLNLNRQRMYTCGFSGGARVAS